MKYKCYVTALFTLLIFSSCKKDNIEVNPKNEISSNKTNEIVVESRLTLIPTTINEKTGIITTLFLKFTEERNKLVEEPKNMLINFGQIGTDWISPCDSSQKLTSELIHSVFPYGMDNNKKQLQVWVGMTSLVGNRSLIVATLDYSDTTKAVLTKNNFFELTAPHTRHYSGLASPRQIGGKDSASWHLMYHNLCQ